MSAVSTAGDLKCGDGAVLVRHHQYIFASAIRSFVCGVEISVITPSLWFYLKKFTNETWYFGLVESAYLLSAVPSYLLIGRLYDLTRQTWRIAIFANCCEIIGNIIYSLGFSLYFPIIGRFVCGLGDGFVAVVYAEIGSVYPADNRLKAFAAIEGGRAIGYMLGPSFNFALSKVNFHIGQWHISNGSSPGFVMSITWLLTSVMMLFLIYNMYLDECVSPIPETNDDVSLSHECLDLLPPDDDVKDCSHRRKPVVASVTLYDGLREFCTPEPLVVMYVDMLFWLLQTSVASLFPLVGVEIMKWNEVSVSAYILVYSALIIVWLIVVRHFGRYNDVLLMLISTAGSGFVLVLLSLFQAVTPHRTAMTSLMWIACVWLPPYNAISLVVGRNLLTKLIRTENQGFAQGLYNIAICITAMIGYLIGSCVVRHMYVYSAPLLVFYVIALVALTAMKKRIEDRIERVNPKKPTDDTVDH